MNYRAIALLGLALPAGWAADPQLTALVMPGTKMMAGVNVERAKNSPFGRFVLGRMQSQGPALGQFALDTGFDWRRDVHEVLIASTGQPGAPHPPSLVLVRGKFDPARIAAAIQAKSGPAETVDGVTLLSAPGKDAAVAFLGSSIAVAGRLEDVKAALARRLAPVLLEPALAGRVDRLSATEDAWVVSMLPLSEAHARLPGPAASNAVPAELLNAIGETSASVRFGEQVEFSLEAVAAADQDATALAATVKMLAGMLADMAPSDTRPNPIADLLNSLAVTASGRTVQLSLSVPQEQVEKLFAWPHSIRFGAKAKETELRQ